MSNPIQQEITFEAAPQKVYEALMDQKQHSEFTGSSAEVSNKVGGAFNCYEGQIGGINIELVPNQRIVQAWRVSNWEKGLYTIARFELEEDGENTKLKFSHAGVPEEFCEHIDGGWHARYWEPLQKYLA